MEGPDFLEDALLVPALESGQAEARRFHRVLPGTEVALRGELQTGILLHDHGPAQAVTAPLAAANPPQNIVSARQARRSVRRRALPTRGGSV